MKICTIILLNYNESIENLINLKLYLRDSNIEKFNFIVADDGSTDKNVEKLIEFCLKNNILFVTGKNIGTVGNIIRAIEFVETDKLILQGGGDKILLDPTVKILNTVAKKPNYIVFTKLKIIDTTTSDSQTQKYLIPKCSGIKKVDMLVMPWFNLGSSGGAIYPTEKYKNIILSLPKERLMMEDWLCNFFLGKSGLRFVQTNISNYEYVRYQTNNGITVNKPLLRDEIYKTQEVINKFMYKESKWLKSKKIINFVIKILYFLAEKEYISQIHNKFLLRMRVT